MKGLVAVVTPVAKFPLSAEEEISLRHLRKYLGGFERYIIGLDRLPPELFDFRLSALPKGCFRDHTSYNRLLMREEFYRAFAEYEYILIYQLDCLVFGSNLEQWCRKGWDYVGAPWRKDKDDPGKGFAGVGNGGFSLRRVHRALEVLTSKEFLEDPKILGLRAGHRSRILYERLGTRPQLKSMLVAGKTILHKSGYHNNVRWLTQKMAADKSHEDLFWGYLARKVVRDFRIPEPCEALEFSFETAPRYCFEQNGRRLPFGCHGWARYDREFWEAFLVT